MNDVLRYKHLTQTQKNFICNGCGSKSGWIKPPSFIFKASCNHHDFKYYIGGTEEGREKADREFYNAMLKDIKSASWYLKPYYHVWAFSYYLAVREFGAKHFEYRDNPRTMKDLVQEIRESKK